MLSRYSICDSDIFPISMFSSFSKPYRRNDFDGFITYLVYFNGYRVENFLCLLINDTQSVTPFIGRI